VRSILGSLLTTLVPQIRQPVGVRARNATPSPCNAPGEFGNWISTTHDRPATLLPKLLPPWTQTCGPLPESGESEATQSSPQFPPFQPLIRPGIGSVTNRDRIGSFA
jgi:hypothetical protein